MLTAICSALIFCYKVKNTIAGSLQLYETSSGALSNYYRIGANVIRCQKPNIRTSAN